MVKITFKHTAAGLVLMALVPVVVARQEYDHPEIHAESYESPRAVAQLAADMRTT